MKIDTVVVGALEENCYVLSIDDKCLIIDPGDDYQKINEVINDKKVLGVLITHSHFDHIGALRNFLKKKSIKVFKKSNVQEQKYEIGPFNFEIIYTPGHSADSITFYFEKENSMFVGDFIFKDNIGRTDLPTGNNNDMKNSINNIKKYPNETKIYNGHGEPTTLGYEKEKNIYFK